MHVIIDIAICFFENALLRIQYILIEYFHEIYSTNSAF